LEIYVIHVLWLQALEHLRFDDSTFWNSSNYNDCIFSKPRYHHVIALHSLLASRCVKRWSPKDRIHRGWNPSCVSCASRTTAWRPGHRHPRALVPQAGLRWTVFDGGQRDQCCLMRAAPSHPLAVAEIPFRCFKVGRRNRAPSRKTRGDRPESYV
jgi:hypothetical protein